jgi:hypothetical protein
MQANIFGEIQLNCLVTPKKKQGLKLDPQRVITETVTEPLKPIKITGSNNTYKLSGKSRFTPPLKQREIAGDKIEKPKKPTYFESQVLLLHKNGFEPLEIANQLDTILLPVNNAIKKWGG